MKQDKHTLTHKKFIKAEKRLNELYKLMRNQPWRMLEKPYQDGWKLSIVLREDFLRSKAGPVVKILIDKLSTKYHIKNPKWVSHIRKNPLLSDVRALMWEKLQWVSGLHIKGISNKEFEALSAQQKKYFTAIPVWQKHTKDPVKDDYFLDIVPHYLLVKVDKYMIRQVQDINPVFLKEEAELKKILAPYYRTFGYGEGYYHWYENRKNRLKAKIQIKEELEETL